MKDGTLWKAVRKDRVANWLSARVVSEVVLGMDGNVKSNGEKKGE